MSLTGAAAIAAKMPCRAAEAARSIEGKIDHPTSRKWRHLAATRQDGDYCWPCVYARVRIEMGPEGGYRGMTAPQLIPEAEALSGDPDTEGSTLVCALDLRSADLAAEALRRILEHYEVMREARGC
ncbi:hypothetical protein [Sagittula stellata]|uniref:Uncharacterized protein n=1 Tax=Sagittula stellata (strain ATCC 700073 / DSM 11524 / E-37) TaxID=388399 RepID=A3K8E7_SAGS3|nr:hypothetical protein [Sagittula stellata]EBA06626.1 hypothetical protein SSE37_10233 [Sagittula stellata E-37]